MAGHASQSQPHAPRVTFHVGSIDALVEKTGTHGGAGLSQSDAEARLAKDGPNELPEPEQKSALKQFFGQFTNPIVLTLLAAAVIAVVNGANTAGESLLARYGDAIAISLIVVLNAVLGYYQERRAEAALDALKKMQTPNARVRRDGTVRTVAASCVVVGDVLEVEAGDAVPADARLLATVNLATMEAALTGESVPSNKDARAELPIDAPMGDRANMLFVGTQVVRGKGRALVVSTGPNTELGKLSALMNAPTDTKTPLEERLEHFGTRILIVCLTLSALLFIWGFIKGELRWYQLLLEAVSLAVAAIPEGLPAITTITLALGMQRMAKRGALVRKLAAVETLGAATVICTDKTGTLTQNEMTVREVYVDGTFFEVSGTGYEPIGTINDAKTGALAEGDGTLHELAASSALASTAVLEKREDGSYRVVGDPTEGALLTLAAKAGAAKHELEPNHTLVKEIPFDSDRKRMTIVALDAEGREIAHTKGSADVLLPLCNRESRKDGAKDLDDARRDQILAAADSMSKKALRVLAITRRELPKGAAADGTTDDELETRLTFLGLVGMIDPPRIGVKEAVRECHEAQVRPVMITGDHKLTAVAIAQELGIWDEGAIALTGSELEDLSDEDLDKRIGSARVFARVTAEQKLRIVRAFKRSGQVVAMTGDGVNDAPALREAHIGIAMGKDGTDVAREAADMVLADDNFATIVHAVREGRSIWRNIQKFIFFLLSSNAGLVVTVFAAALIPGVPPLSPLMILWINLVTNGLPALALGVDPPDPSQMLEPPRKPTDGLMKKREYLGIAVVGVVMGGAALACYVWPWATTPEIRPRFARAAAFSLLALSPLFHALNCRSPTTSFLTTRPLFPIALVGAITTAAAIHLVAVLVPSLRGVFQTYALSFGEWGIILLLSAIIIPAMEIAKWLQRRGVVGKDMGPMSRRYAP